MNQAKTHHAPNIVLFCGLPGSGKTTLAKQLEAEGRGIRICTDDWQDDLGMNDNDQFHEVLQVRLYKLALELLEHGQDVILEDGLWMQQERTEKRADTKQRGATIELHVFDLSLDEIWQRLASRNSNLGRGAVHISREALERCWAIFEKPSEDELALFDKVYIHTATGARLLS